MRALLGDRLRLFGVFLLLAPMLGSTLPDNGRVQFVDVTTQAGISWVHDNAMSPQRYLPETVGGGCAFLDYDQDGWMDIYLVNSGESKFFKPGKPIRNALYRNNGNGTFTDVTEQAGVMGRGFAMGAAVGDYDADGYPDLLVTGLDFSILYHNDRKGSFKDVSEQSGIRTPGWSTSAAWFDYDNDGKLDLYVCQFVHWTPELNIHCGNVNQRGYCIPRIFRGRPAWLFRNNGNGAFTDVSRKAAIANPGGKGLGVVAADINNDGRIDIFHANDTVENYLYRSKGDGTFEDIGLTADVAFSRDGKTRSGMGVDAQDYNDDDQVDLFVANVDQEFFSLYRNKGDELFEDEGLRNQEMTSATRNMSGWGLRFIDYDNDGDDDLFLLNGHPDDRISVYQSQVTYHERPLLFENVAGVYRNVSAASGAAFDRLYSGRGLATGDYDNDGDIDVLFCNNGQPPTLLRNEGGNSNRWLGLRLAGGRSNRDGIGARIRYRAGGRTRLHYVAGGGSYLAAHDPRVLLGFGEEASSGEIRVQWPSGQVDIVRDLAFGKYHTLEEGKGVVK